MPNAGPPRSACTGVSDHDLLFSQRLEHEEKVLHESLTTTSTHWASKRAAALDGALSRHHGVATAPRLHYLFCMDMCVCFRSGGLGDDAGAGTDHWGWR